MKRKQWLVFGTVAALVTTLGTARGVSAAWIRSSASMCDIVSDGIFKHLANPTIGLTDSSAGRIQSNSETYPTKIYCPIPDTSVTPVGDSSVFNSSSGAGVSVQIYTPSTVQAAAQSCTDLQGSLGGSCAAAVLTPVGATSHGINPGLANWQAVGNTDQFHYIYVRLAPSTSSIASFLEGYTIWS